MKKIILQDIAGLWLLLTICLIGGLILNEMRAKPLALAYAPSARTGTISAPALDGDVNRDEMQNLVLNRAALILDARPEIFYRIGHISSALSLPRDDFDAQYPALQAALESQAGRPIVVYCSSLECDDSRLVADSLQKLGYAHVRLYRGGWYDWAGANLPQEKER